MSGALKYFFDETYYPARKLEINKPLGIFISCETDGTGADREIKKIAKGYCLKPVLETIIIKGKANDKDLKRLEEMGQTFAAGLAISIF